jgi:hypothetical protein
LKNLFAFLLLAATFPKLAHAGTDILGFHSQSVRLACGYSADVWRYVSNSEGVVKNESIAAVGDESERHFVSFDDGSWLIVVGYYSIQTAQNNFSCIVDKGILTAALPSMQKPVTHFPNGIVAEPVSATLRPITSAWND